MPTVRRRRTERAVFRRDLRAAVNEARAAGVTWDHIGSVLHMTPEEAAQKYGPRRQRVTAHARTMLALIQSRAS